MTLSRFKLPSSVFTLCTSLYPFSDCQYLCSRNVEGLEESAMECTKEVQAKCDVLISLITKQRDSLLNKITELKTERKSELEAMLNRLQAVNQSAITAQKECKKIAVNSDLAKSARLEQMEAVLKKQEEAESKMNDDADEKETVSKSSDIKLQVIYDEDTFSSNLDSVFDVGFNGDKLDLKYKLYNGQPQSKNSAIKVLTFSTMYKSSGLELSDNDRCVTKTHSDGHRYILVDSAPVSKGIHCWRIKVEISTGL